MNYIPPKICIAAPYPFLSGVLVRIFGQSILYIRQFGVLSCKLWQTSKMFESTFAGNATKLMFHGRRKTPKAIRFGGLLRERGISPGPSF
jgi:hypothetical protein